MREAVCIPEQPRLSLTVTEYVVVLPGLTVIEAVLAPVLQAKPEPPDAVNTAELPGHIVTVTGLIAALPNTLIVRLAEDVQPPAPTTVTVYVVVEAGLTVFIADESPVFHT